MAKMSDSEFKNLKVGDVVVVRPFQEMVGEFGIGAWGTPDTPKILFAPQMKEYCESEITIYEIPTRSDQYGLYVRSQGWCWTASMLEPMDTMDDEQLQKDYMNMFFGGN